MTPESGNRSLSWPPPGLESIHGRLWPVIAVLAFADTVLVPPMLLSMGAPQPIGSLGPFGIAFWVPLATTLLGSLVLIAGLWRLARALRRARDAARAGHSRRTILAVMADGPHDTGFLLTGARAYASLGPTERDTIVAARILSALFSLVAVLLMPAALSLSILLGRLLVAGDVFLWTLALWAPLVLCAFGILGAGAASLLAASARRKTPASAGAQAVLRAEVSEWNSTLAALRTDRAPPAAAPAKPLVFGIGAVVAVVLAILVVLPILALVVSGTIGSALASFATPSANVRARFASVETLRRFALPLDPSISPTAAGEALHALLSVGRDDATRKEPEKRPVRLYREPWWPRYPGAATVLGSVWVDSLFARPRYTPAQLEYLRRMAAHPAHAEFATVAHAPAADVVGTRYDLPFGPNVSIVNLPIPSLASIRDGARAHLALAALELTDGRPARAEEAIREVISVGFRLVDDGPALVDNLVGMALVDLGGDALQGLYRATGKSRDAVDLDWVRTSTRRAAERAVAGEPRWTAGAGLRAMPRIVLDSTQAKGLRWEYFGWTVVFAPCASIRAVAFGPGEDYSAWLQSARQSLVRWPSDEALLDLAVRGPLGNGRCLPLWGGLRTVGQMR